MLEMRDAGSLLRSLGQGCDDAAIEAEGKEQAALEQPEYEPPEPCHCPAAHQRFH